MVLHRQHPGDKRGPHKIARWETGETKLRRGSRTQNMYILVICPRGLIYPRRHSKIPSENPFFTIIAAHNNIELKRKNTVTKYGVFLMLQYCCIQKNAAVLVDSWKFYCVTNFKFKKCNIQKNAIAMPNLIKCASAMKGTFSRPEHDYSTELVFGLNMAVYKHAWLLRYFSKFLLQ